MFFACESIADGFLSGEKALLENEEYFLIFMDWVLPGINGRGLIDKLKCKWPLAKIIVMTGLDLQDIPEGADGILLKPFRREEMLRIIQKETE